jgi:hypothetical protein
MIPEQESNLHTSFLHSSQTRVRKEAEPPVAIPPGSGKSHGMRKSTRLGVFLYIQLHNKLESLQVEYIAHFQAKLNLAEIQRALEFAHVLTTDPRTRSRIKVDSISVPFYRPRPLHRRPIRRIGVGYRDKGSLPRPYSKPDYEKDNTKWVGYGSHAMESGHWDLTILGEFLQVPRRESDEEMPVGGKALSELHPSLADPLILHRTDEKVWRISSPNSSSHDGSEESTSE